MPRTDWGIRFRQQGALFTPGMRPTNLKRFFRLMRVCPRLQGEALAALAVGGGTLRAQGLCIRHCAPHWLHVIGVGVGVRDSAPVEWLHGSPPCRGHTSACPGSGRRWLWTPARRGHSRKSTSGIRPATNTLHALLTRSAWAGTSSAAGCVSSGSTNARRSSLRSCCMCAAKTTSSWCADSALGAHVPCTLLTMPWSYLCRLWEWRRAPS